LGFAAPQLYRRQVAELPGFIRPGKTEEIKAHAWQADTLIRNVPEFSKCGRDPISAGMKAAAAERVRTRTISAADCGLHQSSNVAGATVLSLGSNMRRSAFCARVAREKSDFDKPLVIVEQQQSGTEVAMLTEAIHGTRSSSVKANECQRTSAPLPAYAWFECGGSDGFSGLSANPAIGHTSDFLRRLAEEPSFRNFRNYAAWSKNSSNRSTRREVADRFIHLMKSYNARARPWGPVLKMNPSRATCATDC